MTMKVITFVNLWLYNDIQRCLLPSVTWQKQTKEQLIQYDTSINKYILIESK